MLKRILSSVTALSVILAGLFFTASPALATGTQFYYAEVFQTVVSGGVVASVDIKNPGQVGLGEHSLFEYALCNPFPTCGDRVEVGWNVDHALYGDYNTHYFVFSWEGGVAQGYNSANPNWVDNTSNAVNAGSSIQGDVGTLQTIEVSYDTPTAAWWFYYKGVIVGHMNSSSWSSGFHSSQITQIFGEVWGPATPCDDMGDGVISTDVGPARVGNITNINAAAAANYSVGALTNSAYYNISSIGGSVRSFNYGGPGAC